MAHAAPGVDAADWMEAGPVLAGAARWVAAVAAGRPRGTRASGTSGGWRTLSCDPPRR